MLTKPIYLNFFLPFSPAAESESWRGRSQQQKINEVTQTDRETVGGNNKKYMKFETLIFFKTFFVL
jgi:hypothetical protein